MARGGRGAVRVGGEVLHDVLVDVLGRGGDAAPGGAPRDPVASPGQPLVGRLRGLLLVLVRVVVRLDSGVVVAALDFALGGGGGLRGLAAVSVRLLVRGLGLRRLLRFSAGSCWSWGVGSCCGSPLPGASIVSPSLFELVFDTGEQSAVRTASGAPKVPHSWARKFVTICSGRGLGHSWLHVAQSAPAVHPGGWLRSQQRRSLA